jgi:hypothetical protein
MRATAHTATIPSVFMSSSPKSTEGPVSKPLAEKGDIGRVNAYACTIRIASGHVATRL